MAMKRKKHRHRSKHDCVMHCRRHSSRRRAGVVALACGGFLLSETAAWSWRQPQLGPSNRFASQIEFLGSGSFIEIEGLSSAKAPAVQSRTISDTCNDEKLTAITRICFCSIEPARISVQSEFLRIRTLSREYNLSPSHMDLCHRLGKSANSFNFCGNIRSRNWCSTGNAIFNLVCSPMWQRERDYFAKKATSVAGDVPMFVAT
jgi:hypothetical protein